MTRALQTLLCAVAMIGCARTVELPLEPVEMAEPVNEPEQVLPAPVDDMAVVDEEGAAGMSGDEQPPVVPSEPPVVEPTPENTDDFACAELAKLRARDGTIMFNEDGSATVSIVLANVSDEDMLHYPGLTVWWGVQWRYASGAPWTFQAYGLFAGDHYDYTFDVDAETMQRGSGGLMTVHAEPSSLSTSHPGVECAPIPYEFSAIVP